MSCMSGSGLTRANVPQAALAIDSGATIHFFCNQDLLQSIKATKSMTIHCGGSTFDHTMIGRINNELKHLPPPRRRICIAKDGIVNLLSMGKMVKEGYQVTIDSDVENVINVSNEDGSYIKFVCVQYGLYCINLDNSDEYTNFLTTVSKQKNHFFYVGTKRAVLAIYIQECLCLQSGTNLVNLIDKGGIKECVGLTEDTSRLPMSSSDPPRQQWKETPCKGKNKMPRDSSVIASIPTSIIERY